MICKLGQGILEAQVPVLLEFLKFGCFRGSFPVLIFFVLQFCQFKLIYHLTAEQAHRDKR